MRAEPLVARLGRETKMTLIIEEAKWQAGAELVLLPCCSFVNHPDATYTGYLKGFPISASTNGPKIIPYKKVGPGRLECTVKAEVEGEYILRLMADERKVQLDIGFWYAVEDDLWGLLPLKGDLHMHSEESDGSQPPWRVALESRRFGLDFMALTDHGNRRPSVALQKQVEALGGTGLTVYTGEEVHLPKQQVHMLNIGGSASINDIFIHERETFDAEVAEYEARLTPPGPMWPQHYAALQWAFDKVRSLGGLSVFCHPYWRLDYGYDLGGPVTDTILAGGGFDALELLSGYPKWHAEQNQLQLARYNEVLANGKRYPVVATSDCHTVDYDTTGGEDLFGRFYTLVLARSNRFEDVAEAIRAGRSAAVEHLRDETPHTYGPYRMVKYLLFLGREWLPEHDALAHVEAALLGPPLSGTGELDTAALKKVRAAQKAHEAKIVY